MARRKQNSIGVLLRITAFRRLWMAFSVSSLGDWLGLLATTALAAYLTKDTSSLVQGAAVSGVLVTRLAPDLIFAPIAGALVDRFDRRKIAMIGDTIAGCMYLSIAIAGNLTWLLIAQFLVEAVGLFSNPAKQAMWVNIVPRERLAVANQLNYVSVYGMVPVAALLFALLATAAQFFGATPDVDASASNALISVTSAVAINIALVIDSITYFIAASVLFFTRNLIPAFLDDQPQQRSVFSLVKEGIGFIKNSRVMRAIYVGILGAFGAGGFVAGVAQAYVATMGGGNAGYGILFGTVFSGLALGMLIGPKVLPAVPRQMVFTMGIGLAGVSLFVMSLIQDFVGAAATSVVMGVFAGIAWITGFTMIGHEVADRLRGRVFSFVTSSVRLALLATIAVGPILANGIGSHLMRIGSFEMVWSGPGIVLAASGLLVIGVAIFAGRQVGGLRGELVRKIVRRIVGGRQRRLLDAGESQPGVLIGVVGADPSATATYSDALVSHLSTEGWRTEYVDANPGERRDDDSQATALRSMAHLADLANERLWPAVESGTVVVCRDYGDAAVVRFGTYAGLTEERLIRLVDWATGELRPDLVLLVEDGGHYGQRDERDERDQRDGHDERDGRDGYDEAPEPVPASIESAADQAVPAPIAEDAAGELALSRDLGDGDDDRAASTETLAAAADASAADIAADAATADADTPGTHSATDTQAIDPVVVYHDLAAAAPERYMSVAPLRGAPAIPVEIAERIASVLRAHSPKRAAASDDRTSPAAAAAPAATPARPASPGSAPTGPGSDGSPADGGEELVVDRPSSAIP